MHIIFFFVCVCLQLKTMVFLATMGISGKIYILVLPTENNSLFGDYMQVVQMTVFWVFPHGKFVYFVTRVFHGKIDVLVFPTENNGLFGNYLHVM